MTSRRSLWRCASGVPFTGSYRCAASTAVTATIEVTAFPLLGAGGHLIGGVAMFWERKSQKVTDLVRDKMRVCLWGTRGSIASAGPDTIAYGGNTACAELEGRDGTILILDAGTGIRRVGDTYKTPRRIDILLTHLHMDHIQGLGFFAPFFRDDFEVHVWGPPSTTQGLRERLTRYLSPPLFPVRLRDVAANLELHDVPLQPFMHWRAGGPRRGDHPPRPDHRLPDFRWTVDGGLPARSRAGAGLERRPDRLGMDVGPRSGGECRPA